MRLKARAVKRKVIVPIYNATVWIVVQDDMPSARVKFNYLFGDGPPADESYDGLCAHNGRGSFGLFFERKPLSIEILSHEVFHLTHRILEWVSANFDAGHHEQGSLLNGWLMELVWKEVWG